jgi:hypothetical protein
MKEYMFKLGGLDVLLDVIFNTSASGSQPKSRHRWYYAVYSLYVLAVRSKNITSSIDPGCYINVDTPHWSRTNAAFLWRCLRPAYVSVLPKLPRGVKVMDSFVVPETPKVSKDGAAEEETLPSSWKEFASHSFHNLSAQRVAKALEQNPAHPRPTRQEVLKDLKKEDQLLSQRNGTTIEVKEDDDPVSKKPKLAHPAAFDADKDPNVFLLVFEDGSMLTAQKDELLSKSDFFKGVVDGGFAESNSRTIEVNFCNKLAMQTFLRVAPGEKISIGDAAADVLANCLDDWDLEQVLDFSDVCNFLMRPDMVAVIRRHFERVLSEKPGASCVDFFDLVDERAKYGSFPAAMESIAGSGVVSADSLKEKYLKMVIVGPMTLRNRALIFQAMARNEALKQYAVSKIREIFREAFDRA